MATVNGYTAERMQEIEDEVIVAAAINGSGHLILTRHDGTTIDLGNVVGPPGPTGPAGSPAPAVPYVQVAKDGVLVGTRTRLNLIQGTNLTITAADDSANDEIDVTISTNPWPDRVLIGGFSVRNSDLDSSPPDMQLSRVQFNNTTAVTWMQTPIVMPRPGSIVGLAIASSVAIGGVSGNNRQFEVYKNGVATGLMAELNATNPQFAFVTQASGLDTFVAGDRLDVRGRSTPDIGAPTGATEAFIDCLYS